MTDVLMNGRPLNRQRYADDMLLIPHGSEQFKQTDVFKNWFHYEPSKNQTHVYV